MDTTYVVASRALEGTFDVADIRQYLEGHSVTQEHSYAIDDDLRWQS